jgi:hypothetical protein
MASDARQQTHPANPSTPRGVGVRRETAGQRDPTASNGTSLPGMTCNDSPPKASFNSAPANSHTAPAKGICRSGQISGGALHRCAKRCNDSFFSDGERFRQKTLGSQREDSFAGTPPPGPDWQSRLLFWQGVWVRLGAARYHRSRWEPQGRPTRTLGSPCAARIPHAAKVIDQ